MTPRLNYFEASPETAQAMLDFETRVRASGLEHGLIHLVKLRASQINGCAYCIHMHARDARAAGETEERLHLLPAWRESPLYTDRERAALAWTEALTLVHRTRAPDEDYERLAAHFTKKEEVDLTMLIVAINGWNRLSIAFRAVHPVEQARAAS